VDRGVLETKEVGARGRVWWLPVSTDWSVDTDDGATGPPDTALFDELDVGMLIVDSSGTITWLNLAAQRYLGLDRAAVLGRDRQAVVSEHVAPVVDEPTDFAEILTSTDRTGPDSGRCECHVTPGESREERWLAYRSEPIEAGQYAGGRLELFDDITEQKCQKHRQTDWNWQESQRRLRKIIDLVPEYIYVKDREGRFLLANEETARAYETTPERLEGKTDVEAGSPPEEAKRWRERNRQVIDAGEPARIESELMTDADGNDRILDTRLIPFDPPGAEETAVLGVSVDVTEHREHERELERQREQLAALDDINTVVHGITEAVIDRSIRSEIEQVVCDRLTASDSYTSAWIGAVDTQAGTVSVRTESGLDCGLNGEQFPLDPKGAGFGGLLGCAAVERTIQSEHTVSPERRPYCGCAPKEGPVSIAAIPIVHEESLYGVLAVCSTRENAFTDDERDVVAHLGTVVGHALAAVDRKRALIAEEMVELEFRIRNPFERLSPSLPDDASLEVDQTVPAGDGTFLQYGTADLEMLTLLEAGTTEWPHFEDVRVVGEADDTRRFELTLSDPPVLSTLASQGGNIDSVIVEGDAYYLRVQLAPSADVRAVTDAVEGTYPSVQLVTRQQTSIDGLSVWTLDRILDEELTDRQRTVLEAAFFAGYFEQPRTVSGGEIASSLAVSTPTFHQHLRVAQQTLLGKVFDD
jgi:PAS domain S-box-containing protein